MLVEEVRTISRENEDKASLLKTIGNEYEKVKKKLEELEHESDKEEAIVVTNKSSLDTKKNLPLREKLVSSSIPLSRQFKFDKCEDIFETRGHLQTHIRGNHKER